MNDTPCQNIELFNPYFNYDEGVNFEESVRWNLPHSMKKMMTLVLEYLMTFYTLEDLSGI
jgi:hypothetical protein